MPFKSMWIRKSHTSEKYANCFSLKRERTGNERVNERNESKSGCRVIFNACIHDYSFSMIELLMQLVSSRMYEDTRAHTHTQEKLVFCCFLVENLHTMLTSLSISFRVMRSRTKYFKLTSIQWHWKLYTPICNIYNIYTKILAKKFTR